MENLWTNTIQIGETRISPLHILKEQASQLGSMTKNFVKAEVRLNKDPSYNLSQNQTLLDFDFNIIASLLQNYRYRLFGVQIDISENYPMKLFLPSKLKKELIGDIEESKESAIQIYSELELVDWLRKIFGSEFTVNIISSLIQTTQKGNN
jgi:hypothetical protein